MWRRIRFVVDQARSWSEATGGNLRQYLSWVDLQLADGARVAEAILPETDDDAVRIMTIHGAKGLEFPVTIVSGMSTKPQSRPAQAEVVFPPSGEVGYKVGRAAKTDEYVAWAPIDEQMSYHERIRLLYVACTRARDHLVVSLHRAERANDPEPEKRTNAELLLDGMGAALDALPEVGESAGNVATPAAGVPPPPPPRPEWETELAAALSRAARPTTVSATSLTEEGEPDVEQEPVDPGLQKRPRDLDLPPWLKGRYGTAVGRAVHGVLQTIDLATGDGLDDAVAAQCEAEAIVARAGEVRALVLDALAPRGRCARRRRARTGERSTSACRCGTASSRATSTCSTGARRGWSWSTTRRHPPLTPRSSPAGSRATGAGILLRPGGGRRHRRAGDPGDLRLPHAGRAGGARPGESRRRGWPRWRSSSGGSPLPPADGKLSGPSSRCWVRWPGPARRPL